MIVVKLGGAEGNDPGPVLDDLAARDDWLLAHGASAATDDLQRRLGQTPEHATSPSGHRYRVSTDEAVEALTMAAARRNRELVADLRSRDVRAVGLSGVDVAVARRKEAVRAVRDGRTVVVRDRSGIVEAIDTRPLEVLLEVGVHPVLTVPAVTPDGEMVNVDADRMAAALAVEVGAEALLLLSDVPGLLEDPDDPGSLVREVPRDGIDDALDDLAEGRFKRKLVAARTALAGGVPEVRIGASSAGVDAVVDGEGTVVR